MKAILPIISIFFLYSCAHIYFQEVQPRKGKQLTEIPKELHGVWYTEDGSTEIHSKGITLIKIKQDSEDDNESEMLTETTHMDLNADFQLYQSKDLFVFNLKEDSGVYWEVGVLQRQSNGDIHYYTCNDPNYFVNDKRLKVVEAKYSDGEESQVFPKIQSETSMTLEHVVFSGKMDHKTLAKILVEANLVNIYRKDGTIESPSFE